MVSLPTYDSTKVNSLSLSQSQFGLQNPLLVGIWEETSGSPALAARGPWGVSFDFSISNDSEQGLVLSPRLPFTAATDDLAGTGETATTWDFTLSTTATAGPPVRTTEVWGVVSATPADFADGNTPDILLATSGSTYLITTISNTDSNWVIADDGTYNLVLNLSFTDDYAETVTGTTLRSPLHTTINNSEWSGVIQLIYKFTTFLQSGSIDTHTFAGNTHAWHTGAAGYPMDQRGRAVHDYITGQPYFSPKAVPDGYRDGIMVHPDNYDPPDPTEEDPWTPPPEEGVVDDEITDVEN